MSKENPTSWLRAAGSRQRSDEEIAINRPIRREGSSRCFLIFFTGFVILCAAALLVFALLLLRVTSPAVELRSATVNRISYTATPSASFNVTMIASLTTKNSNYGRFDYENSTVSVLYGGAKFGDRKIGSGRVKGRETKGMNVSVNMRSTRLPVTGNLTDDISSGMLKLSSYVKLRGTVHLLMIIDKRKTTEMACTMNLNLTSRSIRHFQC